MEDGGSASQGRGTDCKMFPPVPAGLAAKRKGAERERVLEGWGRGVRLLPKPSLTFWAKKDEAPGERGASRSQKQERGTKGGAGPPARGWKQRRREAPAFAQACAGRRNPGAGPPPAPPPGSARWGLGSLQPALRRSSARARPPTILERRPSSPAAMSPSAPGVCVGPRDALGVGRGCV